MVKEIVVYTHRDTLTKEYYSAIKRMKSCHLQQHGWTLRDSEINQTEKDKCYIISLICGILKKERKKRKSPAHRYKEQMGGYQN